MSSARPLVTVSIALPAAMFAGLVELARKAGMPRDLYTSNLLIAAYSAKIGPTGDTALEEAVRAPVRGNRTEEVPASDMVRELIQERDRWRQTADDLQKVAREAAGLKERLNNIEADRQTLREMLHARDVRQKQLEQELSEEIALRVGAIDRLKEVERERDALRTSAKPPRATTIDQPLTGPEIGFVPPEALPARDVTAGLADCTRRMIISLKACGLRPAEIARDTDTPLHVVKAVLDLQTGRRRA